MKIHQVHQGTEEWHALRAQHYTASEAPVMMGASSKIRRNELLHLKATGTEREYSDWVERNLFDKGHQYEAMARPLVEGQIGEELFPITGTRIVEGASLLASLDGCTMLGDTIFEHKMWNEGLAESVRQRDLAPEYYWQLEQQLLVSGAERAIFVVSDGTAENYTSMEYRPMPGRAQKLLAGWKQFQEDLANYIPVEQIPEAVGRTPENLPALRIEVTGEVSASNLADYKEHALAVIRSINRNLKTDQDFADAEKSVKWCKEAEDRLVAAKQHALSQTQSIDELFRTIDEIGAELRSTRLELDRLVKAEKENVRNSIKLEAEAAFAEHIKRINARLTPIQLPSVLCNVAQAMKGKRTVATLQDAADTELARAKIEANELADDIHAKLTWFDDNVAEQRKPLFRDLNDLVTMPAKHFESTVIARVSQHQKDEDARLERERERIREEEKAKIEIQPEPVVNVSTAHTPRLASAIEPIKPAKSAPLNSRPSDRQIIDALTQHFRVHDSKVIEWLLDMDLYAVSEDLASAL